MRILYVVDVHDRFGAVADAVERVRPVDALVVGGDITTFGSPDDAERAVELWMPLVPRLLAVAGNCDSPAIDARLDELGVSVDARGVILNGVGVFGVSAAPYSPLHTPYEVPDDDLGSPALRSFVERAQPDVVLCGHIHESRGVDEVGSSQVVNPGTVASGHYALLEIGDRVEVTLD